MKLIPLFLLVVSLFFIQCKQAENNNSSGDDATHIVVGNNDAVVLPAEADSDEKEVSATEPLLSRLISNNEGKYPRDFNLWGTPVSRDRLANLLGNRLKEVKDNFNVETPLVGERGIYKTSGCRKNNCPAYQTTIIFDTHKDNVNVIIDQDGRQEILTEDGKINIPEALKNK